MFYKCMRILSESALIFSTVLAIPTIVGAQLTVYTDANTFASDLAAMGLKADVLDFESVPAGSTFPDPSTIGDVTYQSYGTDLIVTDRFAATSGSNYLGVESPAFADQIVGGFEFDMAFEPSHAIGFFLITGETPNFSIFDNDVRLEVAGVGEVSLDVDDLQGVIGGSDNVLFVGLIEATTPFDNAQLRYDASAINAITFNIDDVTTARDALILGDVNGDGKVNLLDVAPFIALIANSQFQAEADINMDGAVNLLDVDPFVQILAGG